MSNDRTTRILIPKRGTVSLALAVVVAGALVSACSSSAPPPSRAEVLAHARAMTPPDARLAGLYAQSCKACHTVADSGAPLAGDAAAWEPRWAKGIQALVQSSVRGIGSMPPGGQCFACSAADYEALIRFMAGHES
jgi:cytochrome c5